VNSTENTEFSILGLTEQSVNGNLLKYPF